MSGPTYLLLWNAAWSDRHKHPLLSQLRLSRVKSWRAEVQPVGLIASPEPERRQRGCPALAAWLQELSVKQAPLELVCRPGGEGEGGPQLPRQPCNLLTALISLMGCKNEASHFYFFELSSHLQPWRWYFQTSRCELTSFLHFFSLQFSHHQPFSKPSEDLLKYKRNTIV